MAKEKEQITVLQKVEIRFPAHEVEHILKCWVDHQMPGAPKPKDFSKMEVRFDGGDGILYQATVYYEPSAEPRERS